MKIGITGVTGFIGKRLAEMAVAAQQSVVGFSRNPDRELPHCSEVRAFSARSELDVSGLDAVVHLAGESILGLWTAAKKRRILDSRVDSTRSLVAAINAAAEPPEVLISGSAIGYYGDRGDEVLAESSSRGEGFLADVSHAWETEAAKVDTTRTRLVTARIGFVAGRQGGAIPAMKPAFSLGLGGRLGDGQQWMSLVHVDDVAGLILHALDHEAVRGPVNVVIPEPLRNADFTTQVARILKRPAFFHVPSFVLKLGMQELSQLLLESHRVVPAVALEHGYKFRFATGEAVLRDALG